MDIITSKTMIVSLTDNEIEKIVLSHILKKLEIQSPTIDFKFDCLGEDALFNGASIKIQNYTDSIGEE